MSENLQPMKMLAVNAISWIFALASLQMVADILQILALLGSFVVSSLSAWWILKQAKRFDSNAKGSVKGLETPE